ncbi:nucleotide sugar dehydrogenase [Granulicella tundricola]|uniref:Nucleotide sugar dehydrogenase n=1 Tax=Granulicella tundricola (strain ATCC BAA-1859 / DSM 23138 / MP5ACTX9) TaxID=1198114 RepID=E8WVC0_GRATM|nr:nucleotide sugar dehydrogenase [Granulicella tundricola]ADW67295.1 nucleotide sugar dehydrogenase [Granulicella tundricola MP5ACTX9]
MTLAEWLARIAPNETGMRLAEIGVIGLGYVGLPLMLLLSEDGFRVTGLDIDEEKVRTLNAGQTYIHRIEPAHIQKAQSTGFRATIDFSAVRALDAILICVPTPLYPDHTPDMRSVVSTIEAIAPHLRPGQLVVLESTTYPGTTEEIIVATIERHGNKVMRATSGDLQQSLDGVMVAFSPEREDPGNTTTPRRDIPKVVGGVDPCATAAACALYGVLFAHVVPMSTPAAAEMTKLLENIYRSVNIALVNELKQLCLAMNIDIWEVIAAASTKPFGFQAFQPGPGVGGHCIPVDPFYLTWKAKQYGFPTRFIELAGEVNESMPRYVVQTTARALERNGASLNGAKILILGVAYKRDVDDLRESPALTIIHLLRTEGAIISYNDPFLPRVGTGRHYDLKMESTPLVDLERFDCVLIVTDHSAYDYDDIVSHSRLVIDTRNATRHLKLEEPELLAKIVRC